MLADLDDIRPALRCPRTGRPLVEDGSGGLVVETEGGRVTFPKAGNTPVLIDFDQSVIREDDVRILASGSVIERPKYGFGKRFVKSLLSPAKDSTARNIEKLVETLKNDCDRPRVLVIGGGSMGQGMAPLYDDPDIALFSFDIYATPMVQFVADAHKIPLADDLFDAVVVQAVLEHVLEPAVVVEEIWRVLKADGLVYAETPFMQQVHEGAYDFTRFTESGHRYLFRRFDLIRSGSSAGPGRQLMWAVDYFTRSVFRSRAAGKVAKLAFFWAQYFDRIIPESYAIDGASGVYFLGRKSDDCVTPAQIIAHYAGAQ